MRDIVATAVTPADWRAIALRLVKDAREGNLAAVRELTPWIMGKVPDKLEVTGADGDALQIFITKDVRDALG